MLLSVRFELFPYLMCMKWSTCITTLFALLNEHKCIFIKVCLWCHVKITLLFYYNVMQSFVLLVFFFLLKMIIRWCSWDVEGCKETDSPIMNSLQLSINYWTVFGTKNTWFFYAVQYSLLYSPSIRNLLCC